MYQVREIPSMAANFFANNDLRIRKKIRTTQRSSRTRRRESLITNHY